MTANTALLASEPTFDNIKASLKQFLASQSQLKDYNFEGSNLAALIDLLAYNTQQNTLYAHLVFNEMFLDTAQLYDSVASHAKELNYTPRSARSPQATVTLQIINPHDTPPFITIPAGTIFTTTSAGRNFQFVTADPYVASAADEYTVTGMKIFEGRLFAEQFTVTTSSTPLSFIIQNEDVDTSSITVSVFDNGLEEQYVQSNSLLDLTNQSNVFFVTTTYNSKYQIVFGDNILGKRPANGSTVLVKYRVTNKTLGNGASRFILSSLIPGNYPNVTVTTTSNGFGGSERETLQQIKNNAPKFYQARERAVTINDYSALLKSNFPEIAAINVYGGETLNPPRFGKVAIALDLLDAEGISEAAKQKYSDFLLKRSPVTVLPIFVNPDFLYIDLNVDVKYNISLANKTPQQISTAVRQTLNEYNTSNLNSFNGQFYLSRLMQVINQSDSSIISNQTNVELEYLLGTLVANVPKSYTIDYQNPINRFSIRSNKFIYKNLESFFIDNGIGTLQIVYMQFGNQLVVEPNAGTVDYDTGVILINQLTISSVIGGVLRIYSTPKNQDIISKNNTILLLNMDALQINVVR